VRKDRSNNCLTEQNQRLIPVPTYLADNARDRPAFRSQRWLIPAAHPTMAMAFASIHTAPEGKPHPQLAHPSDPSIYFSQREIR
jgi:hypothetical protein